MQASNATIRSETSTYLIRKSLMIWSLLLVCATLGLGLDIDGLLRYRQNVPFGTGVSSSVAISTPSQALLSSVTQVTSPVPTASHTQIAFSTQLSASTDTTQSSQQISNGFSSQTQFIPLSTPLDTKSALSQSDSSSGSPIHTGSITQTLLTTIVSVSGSSTVSRILTTSQVVDAASATSSGAPDLNGASPAGSNPGLSTTSRIIIGGVIGGIGGAILLGGLAVVLWRLWGRRRRSAQDDNDSLHVPESRQKASSVSEQSPFRTNLEQHHAGHINTASNF